jgi:hypothetical protein
MPLQAQCFIAAAFLWVEALVFCPRVESQILVRWSENLGVTSVTDIYAFRDQIWFSAQTGGGKEEQVYRMNADGSDISPIKGVTGFLRKIITAKDHLWLATTVGVFRAQMDGSHAERVKGIEANKNSRFRELLFEWELVEVENDVWTITNNGIFRIPSGGASLGTAIKVYPNGVFNQKSVCLPDRAVGIRRMCRVANPNRVRTWSRDRFIPIGYRSIFALKTA